MRNIAGPSGDVDSRRPTAKGCGVAGQDDHDGMHGGHLRRLLLDAGVGSTWKLRELERRSGMSLSTWQRLIAPVAPDERGERYSERVLRTAADTLRTAGAEITFNQIDHAAWVDSATFGSGSAGSSDDIRDMAMILVQSLPPAERLQFLSELAALAADAAAQESRNGEHGEQQEGSLDGQDPRSRPD